MKHKIKVYDYHDAVHGTAPWHLNEKQEEPKVYEVEAWCVGGVTGIRAFFLMDDMLYCASGDDGHWWLMEKMHKHWLPAILETFNEMKMEIDRK